MAFCIPPKINRKLKEAFDSGKIKEDFLTKTPDEREAILKKVLGSEYQDDISKKFTSEYNLELSEEAIQDTINSYNKINKLRANTPKLSSADYMKISPENAPEWTKEYVALNNRLQAQVNPKGKMGFKEAIKQTIKEEANKIKGQETTFGKVMQVGKLGGEILTSAVYKSLKASVDLSFALRQGFKVFTQNPKQWADSMKKAFEVIKNVGSKDKMDAVMDTYKSYLLGHPNYEALINEGKLAVGVVEDFFPSSFAEKIGFGLGNLFKSSNEAFTIFSQSARFGIANDMLERQLQQVGRELTKDELKSIGLVANSITGRGSLGKLESVSGALNKLFFSARYIRSQADTFIMPFNPTLSPMARQEALKSSRNTLATVAGLMATASMMGADVEFDPRSSNFGKMKVADGRYLDLTAGLGSYIALTSKQISGKAKSATTGKLTQLNSGKYGAQTRGDVLAQWATNKLAPAPATLNEVFLKGETFGGEKPTAISVARNLLAPISADNIYDYLTQEDLSTALLLGMSDVSGLGITSYK